MGFSVALSGFKIAGETIIFSVVESRRKVE
jgi:hypothetical protein